MVATKDKTNVYNQLVNWENTTSDGERFSQRIDNESGEKTLKSYDSYLKKKEIRAAKRIAEKKKPINTSETSSKYTNWH